MIALRTKDRICMINDFHIQVGQTASGRLSERTYCAYIMHLRDKEPCTCIQVSCRHRERRRSLCLHNGMTFSCMHDVFVN